MQFYDTVYPILMLEYIIITYLINEYQVFSYDILFILYNR